MGFRSTCPYPAADFALCTTCLRMMGGTVGFVLSAFTCFVAASQIKGFGESKLCVVLRFLLWVACLLLLGCLVLIVLAVTRIH